MAKTDKERSYHAHQRNQKVIRYVVLIFLAIICIFPFYIMIVNATHSHGEITRGLFFGDTLLQRLKTIWLGKYFIYNLKNALSDGSLPIVSALLNSLIIAAGTAVCSTYFSCLTAYAIHAYDFKGRKFLATFILAVMMIPTQVSALGFFDLMKALHLLNNFVPLIIPAIAAPVVYFFMLQYMQSSLPLEIVEAARIDGSNEFRTFNSIVLPIMKPAIAVQAIFCFVASWNNYFTPNLIIDSRHPKLWTLPIVIANLRRADYNSFDNGKIYMMVFLSIVPVIVVYIFLSRYIIQGVAVGSVKG